MFETLKEDIQNIFAKDPAAKNTLEVVLCYPGLHVIWLHWIAHSCGLGGVTEVSPDAIRFVMKKQEKLKERIKKLEKLEKITKHIDKRIEKREKIESVFFSNNKKEFSKFEGIWWKRLFRI